MRHDLCARANGRHLAVANVGQPGTLGALTDFGNLRQIERVIGHMAGDDRRRQRQAERIEHGHGDLHLRQIGAMILAVSQLEQSFGRHVGPSRRGVDTHHAALQFIERNTDWLRSRSKAAQRAATGR